MKISRIRFSEHKFGSVTVNTVYAGTIRSKPDSTGFPFRGFSAAILKGEQRQFLSENSGTGAAKDKRIIGTG